MAKTFNILTIDGGGIRGVFPAKFLANFEERLVELKYPKTHIYEHFDFISGTSTGGIIAIALALGIPAKEIHGLYMEHAAAIFGNRQPWWKRVSYSRYQSAILEEKVRQTFKNHFNGVDPRLRDVKVPVCVPIFDLLEGKPSVLKSKYHGRFNKDYHIPAYQAALATSAAPTFFDPYSNSYERIDSQSIESFSNKVDGGIFANNPTLLALIEVQKGFGKRLNQLRILSIGTGSRKYSDANTREKWGFSYWFGRRRIIDLFMQSQSQHTSSLLSLLQKGIDRSEQENFKYLRIDAAFDSDFDVALDETDPDKLRALSEKASLEFQMHGNEVVNLFTSKK
ncbi:MAG: CBASS cGAMP-activated phospholipase [Bacteroidota bacterium]